MPAVTVCEHRIFCTLSSTVFTSMEWAEELSNFRSPRDDSGKNKMLTEATSQQNYTKTTI